ncbi:tetratricopeptide repeat protein [Micromonospora sp. M12]
MSSGDLAGAQQLLSDALTDADPRPANATPSWPRRRASGAGAGGPRRAHSARGWAAFAYAATTRLHGRADPRTVAAAATLAAVLHRVGSHSRAARLYQEVIIELTAQDGPESLRVLAAHADLATVEYARGQCTVARDRLQDAWELHREVYGDGHPAASRCWRGSGRCSVTAGSSPGARQPGPRPRAVPAASARRRPAGRAGRGAGPGGGESRPRLRRRPARRPRRAGGARRPHPTAGRPAGRDRLPPASASALRLGGRRWAGPESPHTCRRVGRVHGHQMADRPGGHARAAHRRHPGPALRVRDGRRHGEQPGCTGCTDPPHPPTRTRRPTRTRPLTGTRHRTRTRRSSRTRPRVYCRCPCTAHRRRRNRLVPVVVAGVVVVLLGAAAVIAGVARVGDDEPTPPPASAAPPPARRPARRPPRAARHSVGWRPGTARKSTRCGDPARHPGQHRAELDLPGRRRGPGGHRGRPYRPGPQHLRDPAGRHHQLRHLRAQPHQRLLLHRRRRLVHRHGGPLQAGLHPPPLTHEPITSPAGRPLASLSGMPPVEGPP